MIKLSFSTFFYCFYLKPYDNFYTKQAIIYPTKNWHLIYQVYIPVVCTLPSFLFVVLITKATVDSRSQYFFARVFSHYVTFDVLK